VASSPLVFNGAVYFGSVDRHVYCLDGRSGELRWKFETDGPVVSSPAQADGVIYIGSCDRRVYALPA
jgi:outer membrane protein assembly factor BamB